MERKLTVLFSTGALALALSAPALAAGDYGSKQQSGAGGDQQYGQSAGGAMDQQSGAQVDLSNTYRASNLEGLAVRDAQGQEIGNINHVLIGQDGKVSNVIVSKGGVLGVGTTNYLVPWDRLNIDPQQQAAILDINGDQFDTEFSAFEELPGTALERQDDVQQQDQGQPDQPQSSPETTNEQPMDGDSMR